MKKKNIILFIIGFGAFLIIITAINISIRKSERENLPSPASTQIKKEKPTKELPAGKKKALELREEELEIEPSVNPREPLAN